MADMADYLHERARLIAHVFAPLDNVWFGSSYDWHRSLKVKEFVSGEKVHYQRKSDWERRVAFWNVTPIGITNRKVKEIACGPEKIIDIVKATGYNYDGVIAVPIHYEGEFRKLKSASEAFSHGLTQSIEISLKFSQGGEAAQYKFEQEIKAGFEARQDWSSSSSEEDEVRRLVSISPEAPPGYDVEFRLVRKGQRMKLKVTGRAKLDHGVQVGKYHNKWRGNKGKKKYWPRWAKYDSFYEECLPVLKGEAPRDLMFASHFRRHPAPSWLIRRLEAPLNVPFEHTSAEFDSATTIEQEQKVLRGPKSE